jgi:hypothetical protein
MKDTRLQPPLIDGLFHTFGIVLRGEINLHGVLCLFPYHHLRMLDRTTFIMEYLQG